MWVWFGVSALGATLEVGPGGYATIAEAIDAAAEGDEIHVGRGRWVEGVELVGPGLTLVGSGPGTILVAPEDHDDNQVVNIEGESTFVIRDLVVDGEGAFRGIEASDATVTLERVWVRNGHHSSSGGNLQGERVDLTATDCRFDDGTADSTGGNIDLRRSNATFVRSSVRRGTSSDGAGIYNAETGSLTLEDVVLSENVASDDGGALYAVADTTVLVTRSLFLGNRAEDFGAVRMIDGRFEDCVFRDNHATDQGVLASSGDLEVVHSRFVANTARSGGGVRLTNTGSSLVLEDSVFFENETESLGGAVQIASPADIQIRRNWFCGNRSNQGGALFIDSAAGDVSSNVFSDNFAGNQASDIATNENALPSIDNNTFVAGEASGVALSVELEYVSSFHNNIGAHTVAGSSTVAVFESQSDDPEPPASHNVDFDNPVPFFDHLPSGPVLTDDPRFEAYVPDAICNDDFRLREDSTLRGAGKPDLPNPDASPSDPGAHGGPTSWPDVDVDGDGWSAPYDCDDADPAVFPGAEEIGDNAVDEDCDGYRLCFPDLDRDGVGAGTATLSLDCSPGSGFAVVSGDCDSDREDVFPGAIDPPGDGLDADCDGSDVPPATGAPPSGPTLFFCATGPTGTGVWCVLATLFGLRQRRLRPQS